MSRRQELQEENRELRKLIEERIIPELESWLNNPLDDIASDILWLIDNIKGAMPE